MKLYYKFAPFCWTLSLKKLLNTTFRKVMSTWSSFCYLGEKTMNGVVIIDKSKGYTSHDVVAKLRGILKQYNKKNFKYEKSWACRNTRS